MNDYSKREDRIAWILGVSIGFLAFMRLIRFIKK